MEQQPSAATEAVRQKSKNAVTERRSSARALVLAKRRNSDRAESLRSTEPAATELEVSWASGDRDAEESDPEETEPEGQEKEPEGEEKEPEGEEKEPEGQEKEPEGKEKEPEGQEKEPDGEEKEPEGQEKEPEGEEKEPDGEEKEPEGKEKEPEERVETEEGAEPVFRPPPTPPPWSIHFSSHHKRVLCTFCFAGNRETFNAKCCNCYRVEREKRRIK